MNQYIKTVDISKSIIENIDKGIIVLDKNLHVYHFNRWLQNHTSIKESDILNKKIDSIFTINSEKLKRKIEEVLELQEALSYTDESKNYLIPIKNEAKKSVKFTYMQQDVRVIPLDKKESLVTLTLTDQTDILTTTSLLKANIETIKELNSDLIKERDTIDKKVLVIKFDQTFKIIDISQALLELLEYEKEEILGKNFFYHEKYNMTKELQMQLVAAMRELKVFDFEESTLSAHGHTIDFKSTLIPEYSAKGEQIGFIIFREDITDAKHLEQSQEKVLASSRNSAMGEMVAMIAHQWRQPLSLINTAIAKLKIKKELEILEEDDINEAFDNIESTTSYLSDTIDDFRDFFKPNKLCSEVNLYSLFKHSIFFLIEEMKQCSIEYKIEIDDDIVIKTYKNELLQSIINIVKNSIDAFSTHNAEKKKITIKVEKKESHISIVIEDNAGGIDDEILKKVFEPYFSTKSKNGTGIGLYMCHTIVTQHLKGQITMSSSKNITQTLLELPYQIIKEK